MDHLNDNEKKALILFKEKLQAAFPDQVEDLRLFGSKARGDATKFSDVDVLIVLEDRSLPVRQKIYGLANEVFLEAGVDLSLKIITPAISRRLREAGSPLMINIDRESRQI